MQFAIEQVRALDRHWGGALTVLTSPWNHQCLTEALPTRCEMVPLKSTPHRIAWELITLPRVARDFDLLYCPANSSPPFANVPTVVTQQNANLLLPFREVLSMGTLTLLRSVSAWVSMYTASHVVFVSKSLHNLAFQRSGLMRRGKRHSVIITGRPDWENVKETPPPTFRAPGPFFLAVASAAGHKRLPDLVAGWSKYTGSAAPLVIVGDIDQETRDGLWRIAGIPRDSLRFLGAISQRHEMLYLYRNALAVVSASAAESYPMVVAEARAAGSHLILSDIPSHREVAGETADYFDIGDTDVLGRLLARSVSTSPSSDQREWGQSWDEHAKKLIAVWREELA